VGRTAGGWEVWLGTAPERAEAQRTALAALQARLPGTPIGIVDLRFERPYYRLPTAGGAP
jgi:hypothetical protein